MTDTSKARAKALSLGQGDILRIDELPNGAGIVAYYASDEGLRSLGQSSLIQSPRGGYGLVIKVDGSIPRDAEVRTMLWSAGGSAI